MKSDHILCVNQPVISWEKVSNHKQTATQTQKKSGSHWKRTPHFLDCKHMVKKDNQFHELTLHVFKQTTNVPSGESRRRGKETFTNMTKRFPRNSFFRSRNWFKMAYLHSYLLVSSTRTHWSHRSQKQCTKTDKFTNVVNIERFRYLYSKKVHIIYPGWCFNGYLNEDSSTKAGNFRYC